MNYFTIKKFAQIENLLQQKGFDSSLINQVKLAPKALKRQIAQLLETKDTVSETEILNILQSQPKPPETLKTNPLDKIFEKSDFTKFEFFALIPQGYRKFIAQALLNKEKRPEDLSFILEILQNFDELKKRTTLPIERDINKYQSFTQLLQTVDDFSEKSHKQNPRLTVDPNALDGVRLYDTQGQYKIWEVSDKDSLEQIGENTRWCTRKSYTEPQAEYYLEEHGSIYVVTSGPNLVYQFTPDLEQFMDVNDNSVDIPSDLNVDGFVKDGLKKGFPIFKHASDELKNNINLSLYAVQKNANNFKYIKPEFQHDYQFAKRAIESNELVYAYLPDDLKKNREFIETTLKHSADIIQFVPASLRNEFADFVLSKDGTLLRYFDKTIRSDKNYVLKAVKNQGAAIYFASDELKKDPTVVIAGIKTPTPLYGHTFIEKLDDFKALGHADISLRNDKEFVRKVMQINSFAYHYVGDELKKDKDFALEAVKLNPRNAAFVSAAFYDDEDFMRKLVDIDAGLIRHASEKIKNNREIALLALSKDAFTVNFISNKLKHDADFMIEAALLNRRVYDYTPLEIRGRVFDHIVDKKKASGWYHLTKLNSA